MLRTLGEVIHVLDDSLVHIPLTSTSVGCVVCSSVGGRSLPLMRAISDFPGTFNFMVIAFLFAGSIADRTLLVAL